MCRVLVFVCSFSVWYAWTAASRASAEGPVESTQQLIPAGEPILAAAPIGTTLDILGRGFDRTLSPTNPRGETARVPPSTIKEVPTSRFELRMDMIENSFQLNAHASHLFARAGVNARDSHRYMVLRASYIDKVAMLESGGGSDAESELYASKVFFGWTLYVVIEGDASVFTAEVAARLQLLGLGLQAEVSAHKLRTHIYTIGLVAKSPGQVPLPQSADDIPKLFKTADPPVPIFVEYVSRRPMVAEKLQWQSAGLEPGRKYRIDVAVEVMPSKSNGKPWDAGNDQEARPDPIVTLIVDGQVLQSCHERDSFTSGCLTGVVVTIGEQTTIELSVKDRDISFDDKIGSAGPVVARGSARLNEAFHLPTRGQVKNASVTFRPSNESAHRRADRSRTTR